MKTVWKWVTGHTTTDMFASYTGCVSREANPVVRPDVPTAGHSVHYKIGETTQCLSIFVFKTRKEAMRFPRCWPGILLKCTTNSKICKHHHHPEIQGWRESTWFVNDVTPQRVVHVDAEVTTSSNNKQYENQ